MANKVSSEAAVAATPAVAVDTTPSSSAAAADVSKVASGYDLDTLQVLLMAASDKSGARGPVGEPRERSFGGGFEPGEQAFVESGRAEFAKFRFEGWLVGSHDGLLDKVRWKGRPGGGRWPGCA